MSQKVSEEGKLYEAEEEDFGGINIDKAKMILRAEDKFDKVFQREKIKARKKEEKRKAKEDAQKAKTEAKLQSKQLLSMRKTAETILHKLQDTGTRQTRSWRTRHSIRCQRC